MNFVAFSSHLFRIGSDGPQNEINALDIETGGILQSYVLDVPIQGDWESISLGPCDSSGRKSCLFIGNMGNNKAGFCTNTSCTYGVQTVYIYKLEEPNINAAYNDTALKVSTLAINYEGSNFPTNRANSEALFVVRKRTKMLLFYKHAFKMFLTFLSVLLT